LVSGGDGADSQRSAPENALLFGLAERIGPGTVAEKRRGVQRAGRSQQLKLFPSHVEVPDDDPQVARVLVNRVRLERTRQFGACFLGWELWKHLELDRFFEQAVDDDPAEVAWSRVAAVLAINRLCAPGSELAVEERWYPATALDDLLEIAEGKINDTRLYRCLDRILPHKTKLEQHLKQRYGELFGAEFDVLLYDLTAPTWKERRRRIR